MFRKDIFFWLPNENKVVGELEFEVGYRNWKGVPFELFLDGTSPYPLPLAKLMEHDKIENVHIAFSRTGHPNGITVKGKTHQKSLHLEPDLLHYIRVDDRAWPECLDFKIEYIGSSTGREGNRDFADRLWNHEKVREIAGVLQRDTPNLQIYTFGYQSRYTLEAGPDFFIENSYILESTLGKDVYAEVFEAALIGHFKPEYNREFKNFPHGTSPNWLSKLKETIRPSYAPAGDILLSVALASDNRHNTEGSWTFGRFYTDHTMANTSKAEDVSVFTIDLSKIV